MELEQQEKKVDDLVKRLGLSIETVIKYIQAIGEAFQKAIESIDFPAIQKAYIKAKRREIYVRKYRRRGERRKK